VNVLVLPFHAQMRFFAVAVTFLQDLTWVTMMIFTTCMIARQEMDIEDTLLANGDAATH
jgi:hypothetical protein